MATDVRWEGYSHRELYDMAHGGAGPIAGFAVAQQLRASTVELLAVDADLKKALDALGTVWTGEAAAAAGAGFTPLGRWVADADTALSNAGYAHEEHGYAVATVRRTMPEPPYPRSEVGPHLDDLSALEVAENEARLRAVDVMRNYGDGLPARRDLLMAAGEPPVVTVAGGTSGGGAGGAGVVSGWSPGSPIAPSVAGFAPAVAAAGPVATLSTGDPVWGTGTGQVDGVARTLPDGAAGGGATGSGSPYAGGGGDTGRVGGSSPGSPYANGTGPGPLRPAGSGSGSYRPDQPSVRPGAGPRSPTGDRWSGAAAGVPGPPGVPGLGRWGSDARGGGAGGWGAGRADGGPTADPGRGGRYVGGVEPIARTTGESPAARTGRGGGQGQLVPPMMGAGAGGGPTTRQRPGYLIDDSGVFDVSHLPCTAPVIGEE